MVPVGGGRGRRTHLIYTPRQYYLSEACHVIYSSLLLPTSSLASITPEDIEVRREGAYDTWQGGQCCLSEHCCGKSLVSSLIPVTVFMDLLTRECVPRAFQGNPERLITTRIGCELVSLLNMIYPSPRPNNTSVKLGWTVGMLLIEE